VRCAPMLHSRYFPGRLHPLVLGQQLLTVHPDVYLMACQELLTGRKRVVSARCGDVQFRGRYNAVVLLLVLALPSTCQQQQAASIP
jgi:hypothetical protein